MTLSFSALLLFFLNYLSSHAGLPVQWGGKYILKTEVMFRSFSTPDPQVFSLLISFFFFFLLLSTFVNFCLSLIDPKRSSFQRS